MANYVVYTPYANGSSDFKYWTVPAFFAFVRDRANNRLGPCPIVDYEGLRPYPVALLKSEVMQINSPDEQNVIQTLGELDPATKQVALVLATTTGPDQSLLAYCDAADLPSRIAGYLDALKVPRNTLLAVLFYSGPANDTDFLRALDTISVSMFGASAPAEQVVGMAGMRETIGIAPNGTFGPIA
jgi:hypothetical protein